jgi:alkanesulfonate monooxygenase SsuD/methylene tetrahydromethanopterin reductase-like flavin-dependent oxidoreductase (luciferase family)
MNGGSLSYQGHHFELSDIPLPLTPKQHPHPPMWLATTQPESAVWAASNGTNIACLGPAPFIRRITDAFRAQRQNVSNMKNRTPLLGMLRMIVIGHSDSYAYSIAAPAYERWLTSFNLSTS